MSARDDYPAFAPLETYDAMTAEIDRLRQWKAEAMIVLAEWDEVWEAAGKPGPLGGSKAANVLAMLQTPSGGEPLADVMKRIPKPRDPFCHGEAGSGPCTNPGHVGLACQERR